VLGVDRLRQPTERLRFDRLPSSTESRECNPILRGCRGVAHRLPITLQAPHRGSTEDRHMWELRLGRENPILRRFGVSIPRITAENRAASTRIASGGPSPKVPRLVAQFEFVEWTPDGHLCSQARCDFAGLPAMIPGYGRAQNDRRASSGKGEYRRCHRGHRANSRRPQKKRKTAGERNSPFHTKSPKRRGRPPGSKNKPKPAPGAEQ
jgi:hypothetical protein